MCCLQDYTAKAVLSPASLLQRKPQDLDCAFKTFSLEDLLVAAADLGRTDLIFIEQIVSFTLVFDI